MKKILTKLKQFTLLEIYKKGVASKKSVFSVLSLLLSLSAYAGDLTVHLSTSTNGVLDGAIYKVFDGGGNYTGPNASGSTISLTAGVTYTVYAEYLNTRSSATTFVSAAEGNTFTFKTTNVTFHFSGGYLDFGSDNGGYISFGKAGGVWNSRELFPKNSTGAPLTFHTGFEWYEVRGVNFTFDYEGMTSINKTITILRVFNSTENPISGISFRGGPVTGTNWYVPGTTGALGLLAALYDGSPSSIAHEARVNGTTAVVGPQNPTTNSYYLFQTNTLTLRIQKCDLTGLSGATAGWGYGATWGTSYFPAPNITDANGEMHAEFFPGTYSFVMNYQSTAQVKGSVVIPNSNTLLTWTTTHVTYTSAYDIAYSGAGDGRYFTKPEMELLAGTVMFNFRTSTGNNYQSITISGCYFPCSSYSSSSSSSISICNGQSYTPPGGTSMSVSGTQTSHITNYKGCDSAITTNLTINANNPVSVSIAASPSGTICAGTSVTFTATPTNGGSTPAYQWKKNGINVGTNSDTYTDAALANSDYITCALTSTIGCATGNPATSSTITETVLPLYALTASAGSNGNISPSGTTSVCLGYDQTYTISPSSGYHIADVIIDGSSAGTLTEKIFVAVTTAHTISATFAANCTAPAIISNATATPVTCIGNSDGTITTHVSGSGTLAYLWSNGATTANLTGVPAGTYTFTVTNSCGEANGSATVGQPEAPSSTITGSSSVLGALATSYSAPSGLSTYSWSISGSGTSIVGSSSASSVVVLSSCSTTTFTLTLMVTNSNGCSGTSSKTITVIPSATITVYSSLYTTGTGHHPSVSKSALASNLKVFNRSSAGKRDGNQSHYSTLWNGTNYLISNVSISSGVLVSVGGGPAYKYIIRVPANGHYLIIGQSTVASTKCGGTTCTIYTGRKIGGHEDVDGNNYDRDDDNDDNLTACSNSKLRYHTVMKDQTGKCTEGDVHEEHGSLMMIVSPMTIEFTDSISYLPIVYESVVGDWSVSVGAEPPCGFYTEPATELSTSITDSVLNAIQFNVVDTGSEWTFTAITHKIQHNGEDRMAYSNPIMINNRTNKPTAINIYPNPALDQIKIVMPNFEGKATLYIYNIFGFKVAEQPINLISGASVTLNIASLAQGVYLVSAVNGYGKATSRLIKVDK